jgi:hypothetical protein
MLEGEKSKNNHFHMNFICSGSPTDLLPSGALAAYEGIF